jgi:carbon-monoxide dehydrogenase medium subunit
MPLWQTYSLPQTITEAFQALSAAKGAARVIAGGTDLLLDLQQGRLPPMDTLVDVTRIPEMTCVEIRPQPGGRDVPVKRLPIGDAPSGRLYIGAAAPICRVVEHPLVQQHAAALVQAAALIGGPQVRNIATLGGNVAHALPAADGAMALLALDAHVEIAAPDGRRIVPLINLYRGPGQSALEPAGELLVGFYLPLRGAGEGSAFQRVMRPQGVAIAILNMACWLKREGDVIQDIRLAIGPASAIPLRARAAETALRGQPPIPQTLAAAAEALLRETRFRTSPHRATAEYRRAVALALLEEVVARAWETSGQ